MKNAISIKRKKPHKHGYNDNWLGVVLILPAALLMGAVILYPLALNLVMSFQKILMMRPYLGTPFVGFENYRNIFKDAMFWRSALNSFRWTFSTVIIQALLGLVAATLLNQPIKGRGIFRGIMLIPWITPGVVAALTWRWMYDGQFGIINHILVSMSVLEKPVVWLGNFKTVMPAIIAEHAWKNFPFVAVMLLASMQLISEDLYEAAEIDGANRWQKFIHITMVEIRSIFTLTVLLSTIWAFNSFDTIWILTEGGPSGATDTLTTYVYKATFQAFNLGKAASIAVFMFLTLFLFVVFYARVNQGAEKK